MQQRLTPLQARQKIRHYCAYQERSHADVKNKLYEYGLRTNDVDEIISELISEDFLNETRFAQLYAPSKFRQNQWGKNKIIHSLKQKNVSSYNIKAKRFPTSSCSLLESIKILTPLVTAIFHIKVHPKPDF